ncbi:cytochrome P450 2D6-like isoform X3 [Sapajus apella]|uniref:Cytochrome P450 n=1 Tax=Sapajus apella TaxID=9515 RepID=A0A6J3H6A3_SAPAP|nr:cytochrome P450 2D6-like isoform X3 [Sapajus apella]
MGLDALVPLAVTVAIFLLLVDLMHRRQRWAARYPPGPMPLPGLGNLLHVDFQNTPNCCNQLRRRFGDVFSLQLVWTPVVVLNGLEAVREALVTRGEDTADRPPTPINQVLGYGPRSQGVFMARYGLAWREQRRFCVSTLRNLRLGKKLLEQWVTKEAACLCAAFDDYDGRPFRPNELLDKAASNVIASLTCGHRFEYDDPRFLRLLDLAQEGLKEGSGFLPQVLNAIPVLLRIPWLAGKVLRSQKAFLAHLDELLNEHRMTWDPAQPPRDLTDAFLAEMEKEIDDVIGQARRPEMGDQVHMPYTTAVIHEVQRFGDIVPMNMPHMTSRDIEVQGFLIPKGTAIFANLSSVLKDEAIWEKPFRFHPEHFLNAQARFVKPEAFLPFSAGRRACLGEPLARMELFLFFTHLLQHFSFSVPAGQPRPSSSPAGGFLVYPSPYQLCAVPR